MMTTKKIKLNTWGRNYVVVSAGQGEVNSRFLEITLIDETGSMTLTDKEVILYGIKPDGNVIFNNCTIEDASQMIVSIELTSQMSSTPGVMVCELHVIGLSQEVLKIIGFEIVILKCSDVSEPVESTSEFTRLVEALTEVETLKNEYQSLIDSPLTYDYLGICPVSYGGTGDSSLTAGGILIGNGTNAVTTLSTLTVAKGGTGSTSFTSGNILIGNGTNAVTTLSTLPVANGGTGATTVSDARTNLELVIECGSWTPTLGSVSSPQPTVSYVSQYGRYYTIGNMVHITCEITFRCTVPGGSGPRIDGLPYDPYTYVIGQALSLEKEQYATTTSVPMGQAASGAAIRIYTNNGSTNTWKIYDGSHDQYIGFSGCYRKY